MNCQSFDIVAGEVARGKLTEESVRTEAMAHTALCEPCSMRLREEQDLAVALSELAAQMQAERAPERVEEGLVAEFRRLQTEKTALAASCKSTAAAGFGVWSLQHAWRYAAVAAAVLLLVMGVVAVRFKQPDEPSAPGQPLAGGKPPGRVETAVALAPPNEEPGLMKTDEVSERPASKRLAKVPSRTRATRYSVSVRSLGVQPAGYEEVTTDFIPIAYSSSSTVQEGGLVMRVEMSRYAMARFGFPVNVERYDERVKADVWIGIDGLAHAIRFVQ